MPAGASAWVPPVAVRVTEPMVSSPTRPLEVKAVVPRVRVWPKGLVRSLAVMVRSFWRTVPVALSVAEVAPVLEQMTGPVWVSALVPAARRRWSVAGAMVPEVPRDWVAA